jgi:hypothetical protein
MKLLPKDIYLQIEKLSKDVKAQLLRQGIVVPIKSNDGTIKVGHYAIKRKKDGFYCIVDFEKEIIIDRINLPQAAAVLANHLALGRWIDTGMQAADMKYGHALFDEQLHTNLAEKSIKFNLIDRADVMFTKSAIAKYNKEKYRKIVIQGFDKLIRFN